MNCSKDDLIGYLNSWSTEQHFIDDKKYNPVDAIISGLDLFWKDVKGVSFPVFLRLGRVE
jgi:hypothetical protein